MTAVSYMTKQSISFITLRMIGFPIALLYMSYLLRPINAILLLAIPSVFIHGLILKFFIDYESRNANNMLK